MAILEIKGLRKSFGGVMAHHNHLAALFFLPSCIPYPLA